MRTITSTRYRRIAAALICLAATAATAVVVPQPAGAAVWYWYEPSQTIELQPGVPFCTGGWGIRANITNVPWYLTAGHCADLGASIYTSFSGSNRIGFVVADYSPTGGRDTLLIKPDPGVDGLQQIAGVGKTVGLVGIGYLTTVGNGVALRGSTSGLIYGYIVGTATWIHGERVICTTYASHGGDSGGPVFIHYGNQVYAAGIHVGKIGEWACFEPIEDLLGFHDAWLPVFPVGTQGVQKAQVLIDSPTKVDGQPLPVLTGPLTLQ